MSIEVVDGSTVRDFVVNEAAFNKTIDEKFKAFDVNNDGVLSRCELRKVFESLRLIESHFGMEVQNTPDQLNALYDSVFDGFDTDHNNTVDLEEFRSEMKKIMLAIADGLGAAPIHLVLENDSLLKEAIEFESSKTQ
uniref:EF-hand domain-containing protein n=1 Tax=Araucaria cunninghamii TaxID=56994 RepID=A0A0D6R4L6_ARACU